MQELEHSDFTKEMEVDDDSNARHYSKAAGLAVDIKMGWKPTYRNEGAPIPLYYEFNQYQHVDYDSQGELLYLGPRLANSVKVHQAYSKRK